MNTIIINPAAGSMHSVSVREKLADRLAVAHPGSAIVETSAPGHARVIARESAQHAERIVVVGGDGTINEAANGILESPCPDRPLAVIPMGTGNDFARALGVRDVGAALAAVGGGSVRTVDLLCVESLDSRGDVTARRYAFLYAAVGFAAEVVEAVGPWTKRIFGPKRCYTVGSLIAMLSRTGFEASISADGFELNDSYRMVWAANVNELAGGTMKLSPGAEFSDGRMEIGAITAVNRVTMVRTLAAILGNGDHIAMKHVRYSSANELRVDTMQPQSVVVDGELCGRSPVRISIAPARLRVVVPAVRRDH